MIRSADLPDGVKSRPVYHPPTPDPDARRLLLVAQSDVPAALAELPRCPLDALAAVLARETMGLRLHAHGSEPFLWDVMHIAEAAGMDADEVRLSHDGSRQRRVRCMHCKAVRSDVVTPVVRCQGCGTMLRVREHFSRRLGAYQGVVALR